MNSFAQRLDTLHATRPVTVLGAAVIDVIADAYALPWRGCDIELKQQGVNIGGCALNIAIALKRLGIAAQNALPVGHGVWADIIRNAMAKQDLHSAVEAETGDNGWGVWRWWSLTASAPLCPLAASRTSGSSAGLTS
jgi:hypothetical protein